MVCTAIPWTVTPKSQIRYQPQALAAARSLDGVRAAHSTYLAAARRLRLQDPARDWHVLASAITAILNSVLPYCALVRSRARLPQVCAAHRLDEFLHCILFVCAQPRPSCSPCLCS